MSREGPVEVKLTRPRRGKPRGSEGSNQPARRPQSTGRHTTGIDVSSTSAQAAAAPHGGPTSPTASSQRRRPTETKQWRKLVLVYASCTILVFAVMTAVATRWVAGPLTTQSTGTATLTTWNYNANYRAEMGFWDSCNCTTYDSGPQCSVRVAKFRAFQGTSVLTILFHVAAISIFIVSSFISFHRAAELSCVIAYGLATLMAVLSWMMCIALFTDQSCGTASTFSTNGFTLHWGFAMRIIESLALGVMLVLSVMRFLGQLNVWPALFTLSLTILVASVSTTSTDLWMQNLDLLPVADVRAGPWGTCSCVPAQSQCPSAANKLQAVEALAILHIILLFVQTLLVCFVPEVLHFVPPYVNLGVSWAAWVIGAATWGAAIGVFTSCGCPTIEASSLNWPIGVALLEFLFQTVFAIMLSVQYAQLRLLQWHKSQTRHYFSEETGPPTALGQSVTAKIRAHYDENEPLTEVGDAGSPVASPLSATIDTLDAPIAAMTRAQVESIINASREVREAPAAAAQPPLSSPRPFRFPIVS